MVLEPSKPQMGRFFVLSMIFVFDRRRGVHGLRPLDAATISELRCHFRAALVLRPCRPSSNRLDPAPRMPDPAQVRSMFARIAGRYDLLNRTLSLGIDQRWRRRLLARAGLVRGNVVVDVCCGTGDVALCFADAGARVVGVDFTPQMLVHAERKRGAAQTAGLFANGDALKLPIAAGTAELCTIAFGIRNVADRAACLRELGRVLRPGGRALVLEFSMPERPVFGWIYRAYFTRVLPLVGRLISKHDDAYSYLPRTVLAWPSPAEFQREMEREGFVECGHELLTFGIAAIHWGRRPVERAG